MTSEQKLVFISHVESDEALARAVADGLESAGSGFRAWFYERDSVLGPSYLFQIGEAIDSAAAVVLLITDRALDSAQVTGEVVRAYESEIPFLPVLLGITHEELRSRQPVWRQALGASTAISLDDQSPESVIPVILEGLKAFGIGTTTDPERDVYGPEAGRVTTSPEPVEVAPPQMVEEAPSVVVEETTEPVGIAAESVTPETTPGRSRRPWLLGGIASAVGVVAIAAVAFFLGGGGSTAALPVLFQPGGITGGTETANAMVFTIPESAGFDVTRVALDIVDSGPRLETTAAAGELQLSIAQLSFDIPALDSPPADDPDDVIAVMSVELVGVDGARVPGVISFSVDTDTIDEIGLAHESVSLYRLAGDNWQELDTAFIEDSGDRALYEARTTGFSVFVVAPSGFAGAQVVYGNFTVNFLYRSDPVLTAAIEVVDVNAILKPALERISSLLPGGNVTISLKGPITSGLNTGQRDQLAQQGFVVLEDSITELIEVRLDPGGSIGMEDIWREIIPDQIAQDAYFLIRFNAESGKYQDSLLDAMLGIGLVVAFRDEAFPGAEGRLREHRPERAELFFDLTPEEERKVWGAVQPALDESVVFGQEEFPPEVGIPIGFRIVEAYLRNNPGATASSLIFVTSEEILAGAKYNPDLVLIEPGGITGGTATTNAMVFTVPESAGFAVSKVALDIVDSGPPLETVAASGDLRLSLDALSNDDTVAESPPAQNPEAVLAFWGLDLIGVEGGLVPGVISFSLATSLIDSSGVARGSLSLYRLDNTTWQELDTKFLGDDAGKALYEARTPGFSLFAVAPSGFARAVAVYGDFRVNFLYRSDPPELTAAIEVVDVNAILRSALERISSLVPGNNRPINFKGPITSGLLESDRDQLERRGYVVMPEISQPNQPVEIRLNPDGSIEMEDLWRDIVPGAVAIRVSVFNRQDAGASVNPGTLLDEFVRFGLALAFAEEAFPGFEEQLRGHQPELAELWFGLTADEEREVWAAAQPDLLESSLSGGSGTDFRPRFSYGEEDFPAQVGAVIGLRIVEAYLQNNPGATASSLRLVPASEILAGSNYNPGAVDLPTEAPADSTPSDAGAFDPELTHVGPSVTNVTDLAAADGFAMKIPSVFGVSSSCCLALGTDPLATLESGNYRVTYRLRMEDPVNETLSAEIYVGTRFAFTDWSIIETFPITHDDFVDVGGYRDFHVDFLLPSTTSFVEFRVDYRGGNGDLFVDSINWEALD